MLPTFLESWLQFISSDPLLRSMQFVMLLSGSVVIFLVFYTTRDILLRTNSFLYMFCSIVLVAAFPVIGFLLYLLIRPPYTLREKEMYSMLREIQPKKSVLPKKTGAKKKKVRK